MLKLADIADIRSGFAFRESISHREDGDVAVIQPRNISTYNNIDYSCLSKFCSSEIKPSHFLKKNDILLVSRGTFKSVVFDSDYPSVATGAFFIIRLRTNRFIPSFISTFFNSTSGQAALQSRQATVTVPSITRQQLEQVEIPLITTEKQKKIIDFYELHKIEGEIQEKLQQNKKKLIDYVINKELKE